MPCGSFQPNLRRDTQLPGCFFDYVFSPFIRGSVWTRSVPAVERQSLVWYMTVDTYSRICRVYVQMITAGFHTEIGIGSEKNVVVRSHVCPRIVSSFASALAWKRACASGPAISFSRAEWLNGMLAASKCAFSFGGFTVYGWLNFAAKFVTHDWIVLR